MIEIALTGDDEVGPHECDIELGSLGEHREPGFEPGTQGEQATGEPARCAGAGYLRHIDAVVLLVDLDQALEATSQELDLCRRGTLLRPKTVAASSNRV
ncbi:MAG: hypothetical protein R2710_23915 [Acidimicrobiales bacterium]